MDNLMRALRLRDDKVCGSIIGRVTVQVMHHFFASQGSPKLFCRHESVTVRKSIFPGHGT
jgi:hypothetical protein